MTELRHFKYQNFPFTLSLGFMLLSTSIFLRFGPFKTSFRIIFGFFTENSPKKLSDYPDPKNLTAWPLDHLTLDGFDLTRDQQRLKKVLRSIPDMIHVISRFFFNLKWLLCPGKPSKVQNCRKSMTNRQNCLNWLQIAKNLTFDLTCGVINDDLVQCR